LHGFTVLDIALRFDVPSTIIASHRLASSLLETGPFEVAPLCTTALYRPRSQPVVAEPNKAGGQYVLVPANMDIRSRRDEEGLNATDL